MSDTPEKKEESKELPTDELQQISGGTDRYPMKIGVPDPRDLRDDNNGAIRGNNGPLRGYAGPNRKG